MIIHVLTPVTRPENLPLIRESLEVAFAKAPQCAMVWHTDTDLDHDYPGGYGLRNIMLDRIDHGWCWLLDDDTLAHPDVVTRVYEHRKAPAVVFSQTRPENWQPTCADPSRLKSGADRHLTLDDCTFDTGMFMCKRKIFGDWRFSDDRNADGDFWNQVLRHTKGVVFIDEILSYYNALA